jgi:hypothetical protein
MRTHSLRAGRRLALAIPLFVTVSTAAGAQPGPAGPGQPAPLTAAVRRAVIDTMAARLRAHYVDADTGAMIAKHMLSRLAAGAYDSIASPLRFSEVLTTDLRAVNDDKHLRVIYNPERPGMTPGPEGIRMFGPRRGGGPPPVVSEAERRAHFNLGRVDILPGNVGYLDTRGFSGSRAVEDVIVSALEYLKSTDAIIIDVRRNGGGSPSSVNFLISHFTTRDTVASLTVKNRSGNETFTRYTLAEVPGPRRPQVPLYVLTSGVTASAAEDFTFVLKNMKRATIVGAPTAGAGHNNAVVDVGHGFGTSISFTRVMDPTTKKEWERVGVIPDVEVDQARALDVAHALALGTIAKSETDHRRKRVLDLTREAVEAQSSPRGVSQVKLASYTGEYADGRSVSIENGRLWYSPRPGAPPDQLIALADSMFAVGANRISFERGEGGLRLRVTPPDGESLTYQRTKPPR